MVGQIQWQCLRGGVKQLREASNACQLSECVRLRTAYALVHGPNVCFNAGDKLLKGFPLPLTSVDWHTHLAAAMADGRTVHFTDIFQTRGSEHCTTMPTQSLPDLSPVYAPPRTSVARPFLLQLHGSN